MFILGNSDLEPLAAIFFYIILTVINYKNLMSPFPCNTIDFQKAKSGPLFYFGTDL